MDINMQQLVFEFLGGLGIFLLGIKMMGEGLQKSAGDRLRDILDKFTSNPFMGVLAGIIVTALIQSSSGTTVLTVGLVNAGFMTLRQAIGIIMGANIGTTVTAFVIGINVGEYAMPVLAAGCFLLFFFKHKKITALGQALFGFGALFFGLDLMGEAMKPLSELQSFQRLTLDMSDSPVLGVVVGTILTLIVQSSSATIGILQRLYADNAMELNASIPVLFGDNIGTTITAILASIGGSVAAKRTALTHVLFNVIGSVIFLFLLSWFTKYVLYLQSYLHLSPEMTLAFAHGSFNIGNTIIQFFFIGTLAWAVTKLIPGEDVMIAHQPIHLDPIFIERSSSLALNQAKLEVIRMGELALSGLERTNDFLITHQQKHAEVAVQTEAALNNLDQKITDYLIKLSSKAMSEVEGMRHTVFLETVRDIERIGDHYENIIELVEYQISNKLTLTNQAQEDLNSMYDLTVMTVKQAIRAFEIADRELALSVLQKENEIDSMERVYRKKHIIRLNEGVCSPAAGIVFVDIISNLERIGDHAVNIAEEVLEKVQHH